MEHILSLSYGKDSIACIEACMQLGYKIDRIVHAEVWATDTIPADLPEMVEFKTYADEVIKKRYGLTVEHACAMRNGDKLTYESLLYKFFTKGKNAGRIHGFPFTCGAWCNSHLKVNLLKKLKVIQYIGIAADEAERIERHKDKQNIMLPLVDIGWDETYCYKWCKDNDLLSPIYSDSARGGCWFCHNQSVRQLRLLRHNHPELWQLLLKWDKDSPVTFKPGCITVHDFEARFAAEEKGAVPCGKGFKWKMVKGVEQ